MKTSSAVAAVMKQTDLNAAEAQRVIERRVEAGRCGECGGQERHRPPCETAPTGERVTLAGGQTWERDADGCWNFVGREA